ncbi:MAG: hypothetical protein K9N23_20290 [Akkermansiaceae bacterium]|nr:hypothetical protein [Akkermansiaceae bacterium]
MAIKLIANYSKRLGLPGYSSHQYSVSVETELVATADIPAESARLYRLLQSNVDEHQLEKEFRDATLDFAVGYAPLRDSALAEWREAARHLNGNAEHLIATIEQSFPPSGEIVKRFAFDVRMFQIAAPGTIERTEPPWPASRRASTASVKTPCNSPAATPARCSHASGRWALASSPP